MKDSYNYIYTSKKLKESIHCNIHINIDNKQKSKMATIEEKKKATIENLRLLVKHSREEYEAAQAAYSAVPDCYSTQALRMRLKSERDTAQTALIDAESRLQILQMERDDHRRAEAQVRDGDKYMAVVSRAARARLILRCVALGLKLEYVPSQTKVDAQKRLDAEWQDGDERLDVVPCVYWDALEAVAAIPSSPKYLFAL